jgi:hypothetical protein
MTDKITPDAVELRDKIANIIIKDHLQVLHDFEVDPDIYRHDPECQQAAFVTADCIMDALAARLAEVEAALKLNQDLDAISVDAVNAERARAEARIAELEAALRWPIATLLPDAVEAAEKAMRKYPQPNYVISKWAEETGEVTKALIHAAEGRETWQNVRGEIVQSLAMLHRLMVEGDQVHGLMPLLNLAQADATEENRAQKQADEHRARGGYVGGV